MTSDEGPNANAPWLRPQSAYIHIPFCAHHCGYCDFAIAVRQEHQIELYLDALAAELGTLGESRPVQTIFLGGGTPTLLNAGQLERLLATINRWLPLSTTGEFSVEANPGTLDAEKVAVLADRGVNRVSLGAQSFEPRLLAVLERDHAPADVPRAVDLVKRRFKNVSLDLIFGVPGQTLAEWQADLDQALALEPDHVSTYGLTYEKGTPLWKDWKRGAVQPLDEETERAMYSFAMETLEACDFEHYEISNFARPGYRCRHNEVYWANHAYYGFGMGAARYVNGRREINTRDLQGYMRKVLSDESAIFQSEELPPDERARETMAQNLRRAEGINRHAFREQTGIDLDVLVGSALARHKVLDLLTDDEATVRLTRQGKYVADAVIEGLWCG
ncbi:MAG TPA: radical SAM family heme chaperone HemW [Gemmataceae bacterium]|jgi:oxygen-independent coproporphyrinogen-3 oxidase